MEAISSNTPEKSLHFSSICTSEAVEALEHLRNVIFEIIHLILNHPCNRPHRGLASLGWGVG